MCGRYTLRSNLNVVADEFGLTDLPLYRPRWNIAPTTSVPVIRMQNGKSEVAMLRWGLIPSWTKDLKKMPLLINAMSETAATKPSFRSAFKRRRCLVLADGYYEWQKIGKLKQPWYYQLKGERPFAFAGLWERWEGGDKPIESCTILTTDANKLAAAVHIRMPAILSKEARGPWLDHEVEVGALQELLRPYPAKDMTALAVNPIVNKAGNEGAACIEPLKES